MPTTAWRLDVSVEGAILMSVGIVAYPFNDTGTTHSTQRGPPVAARIAASGRKDPLRLKIPIVCYPPS